MENTAQEIPSVAGQEQVEKAPESGVSEVERMSEIAPNAESAQSEIPLTQPSESVAGQAPQTEDTFAHLSEEQKATVSKGLEDAVRSGKIDDPAKKLSANPALEDALHDAAGQPDNYNVLVEKGVLDKPK